MMKMETRASDHGLNDADTSSWLTLWDDEEFSAVTGLNLGQVGTGTDLAKAIGDKEVAAKAVAFVVNSTRKGIVPLCADVANLLRVKRRLEEKLLKVARENEVLRQSLAEAGRSVDSLAGSPILPKKTPCGPDQERCSSISSNQSYNMYTGQDSLPEHSFLPVSPAVSRTTDQIIIHPMPSDGNSTENDEQPDELHADADRQHCQRHQRVSSLPDCVSSTRPMKVENEQRNHEGKCWNHTTEEQLNKTIQTNNKLSEELNAAKTTIAKLQKNTEQTQKNNSSTKSSRDSEETSFTQHPISSEDIHVTLQKQQSSRMQSAISSSELFSSCRLCQASQAERVNGISSGPAVKHDSSSIFVRADLIITVGDFILTKSGRKGFVRFVGHLDGFSPMCVFIGVQLQEKVSGGHDGTFGGKKYFSCSKGCGLFVQTEDVSCTLTHKSSVCSSSSRKSSNISSRTSSSSTTSGSSLVSKLMSRAAGLKHTHSQKRLSFGRTHSSDNGVQNELPMETTLPISQSESTLLPNGLV